MKVKGIKSFLFVGWFLILLGCVYALAEEEKSQTKKSTEANTKKEGIKSFKFTLLVNA